ncbi:MAG: HU family DNA-binding protein [Patescibacteria group bacterium]|nr:HU family DNA-binding protein [Patescibacteria group bacterium]
MSKSELISVLSDKADVSKKDAETLLNAFIATVTDTLKKGGEVVLTSFGTFSIKKRAARMGRNPQTGESIKIKAAKVPKFKAGKNLKESVK